MPESGPQQNEEVSGGAVLSLEFLSQALRRRSCPGHLIARQGSETAKKRKSKGKRSRHLHGNYSRK